MRFKMVHDLKDLIGSTKAFDGAILYLPLRLPNQVSTVTVITVLN